MYDKGEEAALRPPLNAECEITDSDEDFPLLAQIGANPFGQESEAADKEAGGGFIHTDSPIGGRQNDRHRPGGPNKRWGIF
jgi:hypothetical protein